MSRKYSYSEDIRAKDAYSRMEPPSLAVTAKPGVALYYLLLIARCCNAAYGIKIIH